MEESLETPMWRSMAVCSTTYSSGNSASAASSTCWVLATSFSVKNTSVKASGTAPPAVTPTMPASVERA